MKHKKFKLKEYQVDIIWLGALLCMAIIATRISFEGGGWW